MNNRTRLLVTGAGAIAAVLGVVWAWSALALAASGPAAPRTQAADGDPVADLKPELAPLLAEHDVPALAAAGFTRDAIVALGAAGLRVRGGKEEVTPEDRFHLGSCTKSMTALLAGIMVDDGHVAWETTVGEVLGKRIRTTDPGYAAVTLSQLLRHRAGAPAAVPEPLWASLFSSKERPTAQRWKVARAILPSPPAHEPGTDYHYSNVGYAIAGLMLEEIAGDPYEDLMQDRVFAPLEMGSAGFGPPDSRGRRDQPWGHRENGEPVPPGPDADNPPAIAPAGRAHSTVADFARYGMFHLGDGGNTAEEQTLTKIQTAADGEDYALGWIVASRGWAGGKALTHSGSNTMFYCVIWLAPEKGAGAVAMCNQGGDAATKACDAAVDAALDHALRRVGR